ncbi:MAG: carboxypeptidase regulatory-like domain-containing protein [Candidatus Margulisiibacteriota bacterium]|nr:carboxypeptidase regulatory-like domain-containing protein [Candidatus Margulisiibacteriota bacterium]
MANWPSKLILLGFSFFVLLAGCGDIEGDVATLTLSPSSATIGINQSQVFTSIAKDSYGLIVDSSPTWSTTGGIGAISTTGLFVAGDSTGEGYVAATLDNKIATATVTITDAGWLTGRVQSSLSNLGYIANIKVYLSEDPTLYDRSDSDGRYEISGIPAGTYEALTEATVTFQSASREVAVTRGQTTTWDIMLEAQPGVNPVPTTTVPSF